MSSTIDLEDITENYNEDKHLIFGYTPMCGTCKVSERMLDIANDILQLPIKKVDLNFHRILVKKRNNVSSCSIGNE